MVTTYWR